jgi:hypothetical protein
MRKSRFSEEQIIAVSEHPFDRWRAKYGGMEVGDARKLRALEDENHLDDARAKIELWRIGRTSRISPASSTSRAVSRIRGALGKNIEGAAIDTIFEGPQPVRDGSRPGQHHPADDRHQQHGAGRRARKASRGRASAT